MNSCQGTNLSLLTPDMRNLIVNPVMFADLGVTEPYASLNATRWGDAAGYSEETSKSVCLWLNCAWGRVTPQSFDNVGLAFVALFQSTTVSVVRAECRAWIHSRETHFILI